MEKEKIETRVTKPEIKFFENESEQIIISNEVELTLDNKINLIESFMKNNSGKGKSELEKDNLYLDAQNLHKEYSTSLRNVKYNFHLNRNQWNFLTNLILSKIEYDVNTVFFAIELTDMLGALKEIKFTNGTDIIPFPVNATEVTYIYHLISPHKVKGLTKEAYMFAQVLKRIGNISKVLNYYNTTGENLFKDIKNWVVSFEEGVYVENINSPSTIESSKSDVKFDSESGEVKVSKPKKEKSDKI